MSDATDLSWDGTGPTGLWDLERALAGKQSPVWRYSTVQQENQKKKDVSDGAELTPKVARRNIGGVSLGYLRQINPSSYVGNGRVADAVVGFNVRRSRIDPQRMDGWLVNPGLRAAVGAFDAGFWVGQTAQTDSQID
jgi:hypothetical protein